jgi:hypothetical protein
MCHPSSKTDRHETRVELRGVRPYLPLAARAESSAVPYLSLPMLRRPLYGPWRPLPSVAVLPEMEPVVCAAAFAVPAELDASAAVVRLSAQGGAVGHVGLSRPTAPPCPSPVAEEVTTWDRRSQPGGCLTQQH